MSRGGFAALRCLELFLTVNTTVVVKMKLNIPVAYMAKEFVDHAHKLTPCTCSDWTACATAGPTSSRLTSLDWRQRSFPDSRQSN